MQVNDGCWKVKNENSMKNLVAFEGGNPGTLRFVTTGYCALLNFVTDQQS